MIKRDELIKIGKFNKPHGIKGELSFLFTDDSFDESDCPFLICELDGIFVPFRLEEYRFTSASNALVKLKTIDSEKKAHRLANHEVYFPKTHKKAEEVEAYSWDYFIGFTLIDERTGEIGRISEVDTSTLNTLFLVEKAGETTYIPAADDMITHIDDEGRKIFVELPDGLLELNEN
ncbi:ribosome maturation factor RimM [Bacteroidia bacterium]|nr:ribosome maturation factor RimM [Bacteroidia bacterium]